MSIIARLGVWLGLNSSEFVKGLDDATKKTKEFEIANKKRLKESQKAMEELMATATTAAAGFAAFGAVMAKTFEKADEISDTAKAFDMTVESLLAAKSALQQSGGNADDLSTMLQKLANAQDGAKEGADAMRESFARLGIKASEVETLKLDDLFKRVAASLADVEDAGQRAAMAQDLLGKAVKGVTWSDFVENYHSFKDPSLVSAIEKNAEAWGEIEKSMKSISMVMQSVSVPIAQMVVDTKEIADNLTAIGKSFEGIGLSFPNLQKAMDAVFMPIKLLPDVLNKLKEITGKFKPEEAVNIGMVGLPTSEGKYDSNTYGKKSQKDLAEEKRLEAEREKAAEKRKKEIEKAKELEQDFQEMLQDAFDRQNKFNNELNAMTELQKDNNNLMIENYNHSVDILELDGKRYRLTENQYNVQRLIIDQKIRMQEIDRRAYQETQAALIEFGRAASEDQVRAQMILDKKIENIKQTAILEKEVAREISYIENKQLQESIARQQSWSAGWKEAMKEYVEASEKASERGAAAFMTVTSQMEGALRRFVDTGKFAFKELVGSIVKDLVYMEMKAQATSIFKGIVGFFNTASGGGAAGSISGDLFGGVPKKASGGYINSPTIVGENGAELFIPNTPGTIIPNGSWQQMASNNGGGMTINGNYIANLSAIDTQSGMQFLAKNKDTIWAAYQSANRSVPISR